MATPEQLYTEEIERKEAERKGCLFAGILLSTIILTEITGMIGKSISGIFVSIVLCLVLSYGLFLFVENIKK